MKLTIRKSGEDWYTIERAEHDGRMWMEGRGPNVMALCSSARISDADVEGTGEEMLGIARAIMARDRFSEKRCAVDASCDPVRFWSPRNSMRDGTSSLAEADALAAQIVLEILSSAT